MISAFFHIKRKLGNQLPERGGRRDKRGECALCWPAAAGGVTRDRLGQSGSLSSSPHPSSPASAHRVSSLPYRLGASPHLGQWSGREAACPLQGGTAPPPEPRSPWSAPHKRTALTKACVARSRQLAGACPGAPSPGPGARKMEQGKRETGDGSRKGPGDFPLTP